MSNYSPTTITHHLDTWLEIRRRSKALHTYETTRNAVKAFLAAIGDIPLQELTEEHYSEFLRALKDYSPRTEQLYATLIFGWFEYLSAKEIRMLNTSKLKYIRQTEQRRPGKRLRQIDRQAILQLRDELVGWVVQADDLPMARARALVILGLESGLRVHELCRLCLADLDLARLEGTVIGKGDKQRRFPFTKKSASAIRFYLDMRKRLEPERGKDLPRHQVPVFVSHSKRGHKHLEPIETDTARRDLERMVQLLVVSADSPITPHVLRHFAGNELRRAVGDLEIVRILLGHESIETTKGYMHVEDDEALDAYHRQFSQEQ